MRRAIRLIAFYGDLTDIVYSRCAIESPSKGWVNQIVQVRDRPAAVIDKRMGNRPTRQRRVAYDDSTIVNAIRLTRATAKRP
jgi:hypothetical protein